MAAPTSEELFMLELINEARLDPMASAARYIASYNSLESSQPNIQNALDFFGVDGSALLAAFENLTPAGPLAWDNQLASAAEKHSAAMIAADEQSHQVDGELSLGARITAEGYDNWLSLGENVYAYSQDILYGHAGFMVDWGYDGADFVDGVLRPDFASVGDGMQDAAGHRVNIMNPNFREVGIDITYETNSSTEVGPMVVTQDFAESDILHVTGIAYNDTNNDDFYTPGEGQSDVRVQIGSGAVVTGDTGSYSKAVFAGNHTVEISGAGVDGTIFVQASITDENLKLDIVDGDTLVVSGSVTVEGNVAEIRGVGTNNLVITGDENNQTILGASGNDTLRGKEGADVIGGGLGNDYIDGGEGIDTALFNGHSSQFNISSTAKDRYTVSGGGQGTDTLVDVEIFRFTDGDFIWSMSTGTLVEFAEASMVGAPTNTLDAVSNYNRQDISTVSGQAFNDFNNNGVNNSGEGLSNLEILIGTGKTGANSNGSFSRSVFSGYQTIEFSKAGFGGKVIVDTFLDDETINIDLVSGDKVVVTKSAIITGQVAEIVGNSSSGLQLTGNEGNQTITGTSSGDLLDGKGGSDVLIGGLGSDKLIGGAGLDTAVFSGTASQFSVTKANGAIIVSGNGQGTDSTWGVEFFRFDDGDYIFSETEGLVAFGHEGSASGGSGGGSGGGGSGGGGSVNADPVIPSSQLATTVQGTPVAINFDASDPDGDDLTFLASGQSNGAVTILEDGLLLYSPNFGFTGTDNFVLTASDGNGGSAEMNVTVNVNVPETAGHDASSPTFTLIGTNGFVGFIGGNGVISGTNAFQSISLEDQPDWITFNSTFSSGGDIIKFPNDAFLYSIELVGSDVIIRDNDSSYSFPVTSSGIALQFGDGIRNLYVDISGAQPEVKVGSQVVTEDPVPIVAGPDGTPAPTGANGSAVASLTMQADSEVTVGGNYKLIGTNQGEETVNYLFGNLELTSTFVAGGDCLALPGKITDYAAFIDGSDLVIVSDLGEISIPLGPNGVEIKVGGVSSLVKIEGQDVVVGNEVIESTNENNPQQLGTGGANGPSLDAGQPGTFAQIELEDGVSYTLGENANETSFVEIFGFDEDDQIVVTGASSGQYNFGTSGASDLEITYNSGGSTNQIIIKNVYSGGLVFDEASAEAALGWDFITFA